MKGSSMSNRIRTAVVAAGAFPALACALILAPPALAAYPGAKRQDRLRARRRRRHRDLRHERRRQRADEPHQRSRSPGPRRRPRSGLVAGRDEDRLRAAQGEGHPNIFVMNADGTGRVNLTPGPEITGEANCGHRAHLVAGRDEDRLQPRGRDLGHGRRVGRRQGQARRLAAGARPMRPRGHPTGRRSRSRATTTSMGRLRRWRPSRTSRTRSTPTIGAEFDA